MDENKWKGFIVGDEIVERGCEGCAFQEETFCPDTRGGPGCLPEQRKDKRDIIWLKDETPAEQKPEPKVVFATVRDDFDSDGLESGWSLECRFDDDQKYGAVTIDRPFPELTHRICDFLNTPQEVKITLSENTRNEALRVLWEAPTPSPVRIVPTEERGFHGLLGVREWKATDEGVKEIRVPSAQEVKIRFEENLKKEVVRTLAEAPFGSTVKLHTVDHVIIHKDLWEATRAMAEAFITDPILKDAPTKEDWQAWSELTKFRERYEELRTETP